MATRRPTTVYLWELAWILPSFAIPVGMLAALAVTAFGAEPEQELRDEDAFWYHPSSLPE